MTQEKRLKDAKAAAKASDIRVFNIESRRIMVGGTIPGVTLRCTPGYEPLAPLGHSTFQVVLRCVVLPRIFTELGTDFHIIVYISAMFCVICVYCGDVVGISR